MAISRMWGVALLCLGLSSVEAGTILYVDDDAGGANDGSSWCDAFVYLQDALAVAQAGDVIRIAQGAYRPDLGGGRTALDREAVFVMVNATTLQGGYAGCGAPDPDLRDPSLFPSVLSGDLEEDDVGAFGSNDDNAYGLVMVDPGVDVTLSGLQVIRGHHDVSAPATGSAGMTNHGILKAFDCLFRYHKSVETGAALYSDGSFTGQGCTFSFNDTDGSASGAVHVSGASLFDDCTFSNNSTNANGGALNTVGDSTIVGCTFEGNSASEHGGSINNEGALSIDGAAFLDSVADRGAGIYNAGVAYINDAHFEGNTALMFGAGGGIFSVEEGWVALRLCTFVNNSATLAPGSAINARQIMAFDCRFLGNGPAAAISVNGEGTFRNCLIAGNDANGLGGGMITYGTVELIHCTVAHNSTTVTGGGVVVADGSLTAVNSIFSGNTDNSGSGETAQIVGQPDTIVNINHCCVEGWTGALGGVGNVDVDPAFVDGDGPDDEYGTIDDNYRLSPGSALVDAGDSAASCLLHDLDGMPRRLDDPAVSDTGSGPAPLPDPGCYEGIPVDCNDNGTADAEDISGGASADGNGNGIPDECETGGTDCDTDGLDDACVVANDPESDCNGNGVPDDCDIADGTSSDVNGDGWPDECACDDGNPCTLDYFDADLEICAYDGPGADGQSCDIDASPGVCYGGQCAWLCFYSTHTKVAADAPESDAEYGAAVAIEGDVALVGAPSADGNETDSGRLHVVAFDGETWDEAQVLDASDGATGDAFGASMALATGVIVAGAPGDDDACPGDPDCDSGAVYVFTYAGDSWQESTKLVAPDASASSRFGESVAIDGSTLLVGAPGGTGTGGVYVFAYDGVSWAPTQVLVPSNGSAGDEFGVSVALAGGTAVIGASQHDGLGPGDTTSNSGAAYVFEFDGVNWVESAQIASNDLAAQDGFGRRVGVDGRISVSGGGSVYLFYADGAAWIEETRLFPDELMYDFGRSLSIDGDQVLVGGTLAEANIGVAYLFRDTVDGWKIGARLQAADAFDGDEFGAAVGLAGEIAVAGATGTVGQGVPGAGAAYFFDISTDCNGNGRLDSCDILSTESADCQGDGIPDECQLEGNDDVPPGGDGTPDECNCVGDGDCDDGMPCNGLETCVMSFCMPGDPVEVPDDGIDCTIDQCNPVSGEVEHIPTDSLCDDGNPCTVDTCDLGPSEDPHPPHETCVNDAEAADGQLCNPAAQCSAGACVPCPDGICPCVDDSQCDDLNPCDGIETCNLATGWCQFGTPINVSDGVDCTVDVCDPETGQVSHIPNDGNCDDGDPCTSDTCDALEGCLFEVTADDGTYCGTHENPGACVGGVCLDACVIHESDQITSFDARPFDHFGDAVAISGKWLLAGARAHDAVGVSTGAAYFYEQVEGAWIFRQKVLASDTDDEDQFGYAVAMQGDHAIIAAPYKEPAGVLYFFRLEGDTWVEGESFTPPEVVEPDRFGTTVDMSDGVAVAGTTSTSNSLSRPVSVYRFDGATWQLEAELLRDGPITQDDFGESVAVDGDVIVIGARSDDVGASNGGAAYIYRFTGSEWAFEQVVRSSDVALGDQFGSSLAIEGDLLAVGAVREDGVCPDTCEVGAAYVFRYNGVQWIEEGKFNPPDGEFQERFGATLEVAGSHVVVGTRFNRGACEDESCSTGAVYVYGNHDGDWLWDAKIFESEVDEGSNFGVAISLDGQRLVVGARSNDAGESAGAVFTVGGLGDCTGNGVLDGCEVAAGELADSNDDGSPDTCDAVKAVGGRYVAVTPAADLTLDVLQPVALRLGVSGDDACAEVYVRSDGGTGPLAEAAFLTPDAWGTVYVHGAFVFPNGSIGSYLYDVTTDAGRWLGDGRTWEWGDTDNNGVANFADIQLIVQGFAGNFEHATLYGVDLWPCAPDGIVNFTDIQQGVFAFQGMPFESGGCPAPCP